MLPREDEGVSVNEGIKRVFRLMKEEGLPVLFTPGVIHLPTVPRFRKINKIDMGTADKVCAVALALKDHTEFYGIGCEEASFIFVEIGFGFNAIIGIKEGRIVDGLGGTSGVPGFLSPGALDGELAIRIPLCPQSVLFTGGIKDLAGEPQLSPEEFASRAERYGEAWELFLESLVKGVSAMLVSVPSPKEIILSGRLSRVPGIYERIYEVLSKYAPVRRVRREAKVAKEAAEGAYIVGEGLLGGRYKSIVDSLRLREAKGTMFDYILIKAPLST